MAATKFTDENRILIVDRIRQGDSLAAVCKELDVRLKTAEGWLTRGRKEMEDGKETTYAEFAQRIEEARRARELAVLTADEFHEHLAKQVRKGSVNAMKLWWNINGAEEDPDSNDEPADPFDTLEEEDELAKKRQTKAG